jgi:hypothetical protein
MNAYRLGNTLSEFGAVARGICKISSDNFLQKVEEHHGISKDQMGNNVSHLKEGRVILADDEPVSMNIWAFLPSVFKHFEEYLREFMLNLTDNKKEEAYIPAFVDYLVRNNIAKVKVYQSGAEWFGVTYAQDKPQVMQKLSILTDENQYPSHLFF